MGIFNVMDFGAVGDGIASDNAAIAAAITAASSGSHGGVVYFPTPSNHYKITSPIVMTDCITLQGDGMDATLIRQHSAADGIQIIGSSLSAQVSKTSVRDLSIYGYALEAGGPSSSVALVGLHLSFGGRGNYRNVRIRGFETGVKIEQSWNVSFLQVTTDACRSYGWHLGKEANNVGLYNCIATEIHNASNSAKAYYIYGARALQLNNCDCEGNDFGVYITSHTAQKTEKVSIIGGYFEANTVEDIRIEADDETNKPKAISVRDVYFVRAGGTAMSIRVLQVQTLLLDGNLWTTGDSAGTYTYSLYLSDAGAAGQATGVVWGPGNLDQSSTGQPFVGTNKSYSTVDETVHS